MNWFRKVCITSMLVVLCSSVSVHAQGSKRGSVSISCACEDATGKLYASALHEALTKSSHYREVSLVDGMEKNAIRISIVSLPMDGREDGQSRRTALSVVCLYKGVLVHQFIETCNSISIESCAEQTLAQFDSMTT